MQKNQSVEHTPLDGDCNDKKRGKQNVLRGNDTRMPQTSDTIEDF